MTTRATRPRATRHSASPADGLITCRQALTPTDIAEHLHIRRQVFVDEQAIFTDSDTDVHDEDPTTIRLLGRCEGVPAGSVRLFEVDAAGGVWQGDRLAVLRLYRVRGVGAPLVRCAVATAAAHGGSTMTAHIQLPNVAFFTRLGWYPTGETEVYAGLEHQPMAIDLPSTADGAVIARRLFDGIRR